MIVRTSTTALLVACVMSLAPASAQSGRVRRVDATPAAPTPTSRPHTTDTIAPPPAASGDETGTTDPSAPTPTSAAGAPAQPAPSKAAPKPTNVRFTVHYDGGSIGLQHDAKIALTVKDGTLSLAEKATTTKVLTDQIRSITYSQVSRTRTAEGIGVGVLVPAAGTILGNSRKTNHYVEILWEGSEPGGVSLRVDKNDYRGLLAALESSTGLKAKVEPALTRDWP